MIFCDFLKFNCQNFQHDIAHQSYYINNQLSLNFILFILSEYLSYKNPFDQLIYLIKFLLLHEHERELRTYSLSAPDRFIMLMNLRS